MADPTTPEAVQSAAPAMAAVQLAVMASRIDALEKRVDKIEIELGVINDKLDAILEVVNKTKGALEGAAVMAKVGWAVFGGVLVAAATHFLK